MEVREPLGKVEDGTIGIMLIMRSPFDTPRCVDQSGPPTQCKPLLSYRRSESLHHRFREASKDHGNLEFTSKNTRSMATRSFFLL